MTMPEEKNISLPDEKEALCDDGVQSRFVCPCSK
jgi:hypothetical protein